LPNSSGSSVKSNACASRASARNRAERERDALRRDLERVRRENDRLRKELDLARRAGKRQAAPFSTNRPSPAPGRPGRKPGAAYGRRARRPIPTTVDAQYDAPLPASCPACAGTVIETDVETQYHEDLPPVRPFVRAFLVHIGTCATCGRRVQGRHPLQRSDAHKLAILVYGALKGELVYTAAGADAYDLHQRTRTLRRLRQRAATLGFELVNRETGEVLSTAAS
jgi:hypothetical protein